MSRLFGWVEGSALTLLVLLSVVLVGRLWFSLPSLAYLPAHNAYTPPPPVPVLSTLPLAIEALSPNPGLELPQMAGYRRLWAAWEADLPPLSGGETLSAQAALSDIRTASPAMAAVWPSAVPFSGAAPSGTVSLIVITGGSHPAVFWLESGSWHRLTESAPFSPNAFTRLPAAFSAGTPSMAHPLLLMASGSLPGGAVVAAPVPVNQLVPSFLPLPLSVQAIDEGADGVAYTDGAAVLHVDRSGAFQVTLGSAAPDFFGLGPLSATESFVSSHPGFSPDMTVSQITTAGSRVTVGLALTLGRLVVFGPTGASVELRQSAVIAASSAGLGVAASGSQPFSIEALNLALGSTLSSQVLTVVPVELDQNGQLTVGAAAVLTTGKEVVVPGGNG